MVVKVWICTTILRGHILKGTFNQQMVRVNFGPELIRRRDSLPNTHAKTMPPQLELDRCESQRGRIRKCRLQIVWSYAREKTISIPFRAQIGIDTDVSHHAFYAHL